MTVEDPASSRGEDRPGQTSASGTAKAGGPGPRGDPAELRERTKSVPLARGRSRPIRRVPPPRMVGLLDSPVRNLTAGVTYTAVVMLLGTSAYMLEGWNFRDAIYMVITTVFTVGYGEVHAINTVALNVITLSLIVFGCTGIIFLTGALVQFITLNHLNKAIGLKRMNSQIDALREHVVVCGFGRLGAVLAKSLRASSAAFVIIEESEARANEARAQGYLCIEGNASSEAALLAAGVERAHALATVLSSDAVNVFITLSARALNPTLSIIARGELSSTESKLLQAGADSVVLPTHISAERIAELVLYQESARIIESLERSHGFQRVLRNFGIELEVVTAAPHSTAVRMTVAALERQAKGAFFIVQINRRDGDVLTNPASSTVVGEGDGVVLLGRPNRADILTALFEARQKLGPRG